MIMIFVLLASLLAIRIVPVVLVDIAATAIGIFIIWRCRVLARQLLAQRHANPSPASAYARPSRRQRRIAARALRWSLRRTELMSLLPLIDARAERVVAAIEEWHRMNRVDRSTAPVR